MRANAWSHIETPHQPLIKCPECWHSYDPKENSNCPYCERAKKKREEEKREEEKRDSILLEWIPTEEQIDKYLEKQDKLSFNWTGEHLSEKEMARKKKQLLKKEVNAIRQELYYFIEDGRI